MKIHRAIRPSSKENEHYLYHIEYTAQGLLIQVVNTTIHHIDDKGVISENLVPEYKLDEANSACVAILAADGIVELLDE